MKNFRIHNTKKIPAALIIAAILLTALLLFTTCKQFLDDPEEFLSYWASEAVVTSFDINGTYQTSNEGVPCVPSATEVTVTLKVHNPKNFTFKMPGEAGAPSDIVTFGSGVSASSGTDYTLVQNSRDTLTLTYKAAFLKRYECSSANIGASIRLYSTDGRRFNQPYSFNLEANTPPKLSYVTIGKTKNPIGGKYYYVIILKAEDMGLQAGEGTSAGRLHKDIKTLAVEGGDSAGIAFTPGNTGFDVGTGTAENRRLLTKDEVDPLAEDEGPESLPAWSSINLSDPWLLFYKTDAAVQTASKTYTFKLVDGKGLTSAAHTVSTETKVKDVKLFAGPTTSAPEITENPESSPYEMNAKLGANKVIVTAKTETVGAIITGKFEWQDNGVWKRMSDINSDTNEIEISLPAPGPGLEILYKITVTAGGEGFAPGTEKVFYVKVTNKKDITINGGTGSAWDELKNAVENDTAAAAHVIIINGEIKAPVGATQIVVKRPVTIRGKTDYQTDKLNAQGNTFIFDIWQKGDLTLEKLTLQNGKNTDVVIGKLGGAIYCAGGKLTAANVLIENCEAKYGGGIYAKKLASTTPEITLKSTQIKGCTAEENGGAIYSKDCTFNMNNCTVGGPYAADGNKAKNGGGIYIADGTLTLEDGTVISNNTAQNDGGGVYVNADGAGAASLKMEKSATVTLSTAPDENAAGKNDVYLNDFSNGNGGYNYAKIIVTGELASTSVARLTMRNNYTDPLASGYTPRVVVRGYVNSETDRYILKDTDVSRFKVTPQITQLSPLTLKNWRLEHSNSSEGKGVLTYP